jgi:hypothetical protein
MMDGTSIRLMIYSGGTFKVLNYALVGTLGSVVFSIALGYTSIHFWIFGFFAVGLLIAINVYVHSLLSIHVLFFAHQMSNLLIL